METTKLEYSRGKGISSGTMKCIEIRMNTNDKDILLNQHWHWKTKATGSNGIKYP